MSARAVPPTSELFSKAALSARHPELFPPSRIAWACRNRERNGFDAAVFDGPCGLLIWEVEAIRWLLGLTGKAKPRAPRRKRAK